MLVSYLLSDRPGLEPVWRAVVKSKAEIGLSTSLITTSCKTASLRSNHSHVLGLTYPATAAEEGIRAADPIALSKPAAVIAPKSLSHYDLMIYSNYRFKNKSKLDALLAKKE